MKQTLLQGGVHGIVLLDKPVGITSFVAAARVKSYFRAKKAGHTGSLDPLASGLLPICLGEATKFARFMLHANKSYRVVALLGVVTTTGDAEGTVLSHNTAAHTIDCLKIEQVLSQFRGNIEQLPPHYSAVKHKGKPLYRLARQGIKTERKIRHVSILNLNLLHYSYPYLCLDVTCTKGTYIRSLVEDIGKQLGVGAFVMALRRTSIGNSSLNESITLQALKHLPDQFLKNAYLRPVDEAIVSWPIVWLDDDQSVRIQQGQIISVVEPSLDPLLRLDTWVRLATRDNKQLLGIAQIGHFNAIKPRCLLTATLPVTVL